MQDEINLALPATEVRFLGINEIGEEEDNARMSAGRALPWLQDTVEQKVWEAWRVAWRDLVVLGEENDVLVVYNLSSFDLNDPVNYAALKAYLLEVAR